MYSVLIAGYLPWLTEGIPEGWLVESIDVFEDDPEVSQEYSQELHGVVQQQFTFEHFA